MRSIRSNGYLAVVLTFSFLLVMAAPALAVVKMNDVVNEVRNDTTVAATGKFIKESIKNRDGRKEFTAAELEEMRAALLGLLSTTYYATPLFDKGQASGQTADNYAELNAQINELSAVELTSFRKVLNPVLIQQRLRVALEKLNGDAVYNKYLSAQDAALATKLSDKAIGIIYPGMTRYPAGTQRGDTKDGDTYFSVVLKIGLRLGPIYESSFAKRAAKQMRCPTVY